MQYALLSEDDRRLDSEVNLLRKESQALNEALIKSRIEGNELREKLRLAQADAMRADFASKVCCGWGALAVDVEVGPGHLKAVD